MNDQNQPWSFGSKTQISADSASISPRQSSSPPPIITWADIDANNNVQDDQPAPSHPAHQYDLRDLPRFFDDGVTIPVLDQDVSATYDPTSGNDPYLHLAPADLTRPKRPRRDITGPSSRRKVKKSKSYRDGRFNGLSCIVSLRISSILGLAKLFAIGNNGDQWYDDEARGDDESTSWDGDTSGSESQDENFKPGYNLRDRWAGLDQGEDAADEFASLTLGQPKARGCRACYQIGHDCPLIDGHKWPCSTCQEEAIECELILEPKEKGRCLACTKARIICPFVNDSRARLPCRCCLEKRVRCITGPLHGQTRTGPCYDFKITKKAAPRRQKKLKCLPCRQERRECDYIPAQGTMPCTRCAQDQTQCTIGAAKQTQREKRKKCVETLGQSSGSDSQRSEIRVIRTRYAHPIQTNTTRSCDWCSQLAFGLFGFGEVTVEVLDDEHGQGYIELHGGYIARGQRCSRMCGDCSATRLQIAACQTHEMTSLSTAYVQQADNVRLTDHIWSKLGDLSFECCAICPSVAFYRCCRGQGRGNHFGLTGGPVMGCGLRLCAACAFSLVKDHQGTLETLIQALKAEQASTGQLCTRADADLYLPDGDLLRRRKFVEGVIR